jgi:hypothetical protein
VAEATAKALTNREVVEHALALYAILCDAIESGQQVVLQYLFDAPGEPMIRIDHYLPPPVTADLTEKPELDPSQRTHAELAAWPKPGF